MQLSVLIPVFNEERYVTEVLDRVLSVDLSPLGVEREILLVDDLSLIHISEPTRPPSTSRMPSSA